MHALHVKRHLGTATARTNAPDACNEGRFATRAADKQEGAHSFPRRAGERLVDSWAHSVDARRSSPDSVGVRAVAYRADSSERTC